MRMRRLCLCLVGLALAGVLYPAAADSPVRFEGGDGQSETTAVVIIGAKNEAEGIAAERNWVARLHPTWRKATQALLSGHHRSFDLITYDSPDGPHKIWFDITDFFGKF